MFCSELVRRHEAESRKQKAESVGSKTQLNIIKMTRASALLSRSSCLSLQSRKQELEADQIGMDLAARTCFDPAAGKHVRTPHALVNKAVGERAAPGIAACLARSMLEILLCRSCTACCLQSHECACPFRSRLGPELHPASCAGVLAARADREAVGRGSAGAAADASR